MMLHGPAMSKAKAATVDAEGFAPVTTSRHAALPLTRAATGMMIIKHCCATGPCDCACKVRIYDFTVLLSAVDVESPNCFGALPDLHDDFLGDLDTVLDSVNDGMNGSPSLDRELQHAASGNVAGGECQTMFG